MAKTNNFKCYHVAQSAAQEGKWGSVAAFLETLHQ